MEDRANARQGMNRELTVAVIQGQVEFFIKQHPFSHDALVHHTVSERRRFTREVYDYARRHGLNSVEAQQAIQAARRDYRKKRHLATVLAWVDEAAQMGRTMEDAMSDIREEHGWDTDEMEGNFDTDDEGTNFGSEVDDSEQPLKLPVRGEGPESMRQLIGKENQRIRKEGQKDTQERCQKKKDCVQALRDAEGPEKGNPATENPSKKRKKQQESRSDEGAQPERPLKRSKRLAAKADAQGQAAEGSAAADTSHQADDQQSQAVAATSKSRPKKLGRREKREMRAQKRLAKAARKAERDAQQEENHPPLSAGQEGAPPFNVTERAPSQHTRATTAIPVVNSESHTAKCEQGRPGGEGGRTQVLNDTASAGAQLQDPPQYQNTNSVPLGPRGNYGPNMSEHRQSPTELLDALFANARKTVEPTPVAAVDQIHERSIPPGHEHPSTSNILQPQSGVSEKTPAACLPSSLRQLSINESPQGTKEEEDGRPPDKDPIHPTPISLPASQPPQPPGYESVLTASTRALTTRVPSTSPYFLAPRRGSNKSASCIPFPPISHPRFGLIQESVACNPFQLLIAVNFLNRTRGMQAIPAFYNMIVLYPTPSMMAVAIEAKLARQIQHLGLQNVRARRFIDLARAWTEQPPIKGRRFRRLHYPRKGDGHGIKPREILSDDDPRTGAWEIAHIPSTGPYALDSWRIFCRDQLRGLAKGWNGEGAAAGFEPEWKRVLPLDKELRAFLRWMWLKEGISWDPCTGMKEPAGEELMGRARQGGLVWDLASSEPLGYRSREPNDVTPATQSVEQPAGST